MLQGCLLLVFGYWSSQEANEKELFGYVWNDASSLGRLCEPSMQYSYSVRSFVSIQITTTSRLQTQMKAHGWLMNKLLCLLKMMKEIREFWCMTMYVGPCMMLASFIYSRSSA